MGFISSFVKCFNVLMALHGLTVLGCGIYISTQVSSSSLAYILMAVGLYILLVALLGYKSGGSGSKSLVACYASFFFLVIVLHATIAIGFLFYEDSTLDQFKRLSSSDASSVRDYVDAHHEALKNASIAVLALEVLTFSMVSCCARSVAAGQNSLDDDLVSGSGYAEMNHVANNDNRYGLVSSTPATDRRREEMSNKYGGLFAKQDNTQQV